MARQVTLTREDPTVFAVCSGPCGQRGRGTKAGRYYGRAFTTRKWSKAPTCENCNSPMRELHRTAVD